VAPAHFEPRQVGDQAGRHHHRQRDGQIEVPGGRQRAHRQEDGQGGQGQARLLDHDGHEEDRVAMAQQERHEEPILAV
jgi:hypothetical protein